MKTATLTLRVQPELKSSVEEILSSFGITLSEAITMYLNMIRQTRGIPFRIEQSRLSEHTLEAVREGYALSANPNGGYSTMESLKAALLADD